MSTPFKLNKKDWPGWIEKAWTNAKKSWKLHQERKKNVFTGDKSKDPWAKWRNK